MTHHFTLFKDLSPSQ